MDIILFMLCLGFVLFISISIVKTAISDRNKIDKEDDVD